MKRYSNLHTNRYVAQFKWLNKSKYIEFQPARFLKRLLAQKIFNHNTINLYYEN